MKYAPGNGWPQTDGAIGDEASESDAVPKEVHVVASCNGTDAAAPVTVLGGVASGYATSPTVGG
jgi:hypothetical protein